MLRFLSKSPEPENGADRHLSDPVLNKGEALSRRARLWMIWERFAPVLALAALLAALFIAGAFAGLWQRIGDPWRLMALIAAIYFIVRAGLAARVLPVPSKSQARRRVERDSGAAHRPLETLRDRAALNAQSENGQTGLWSRHQEKARKAAEALKPAKPVPVIAPKDKYYLRFIAPALVLLAGFIGYGDNQERLRRALSPGWQSALDPAGVTFDAWVDPPDYTGRPPVYFKGKQTVEIPEGSELVARIQGAKDAPRLKLMGKFGLLSRKYLSLNRLGPDSFEARTVLKRDAKAVWRIGQKRREWTLNVVADRAPQVDWTAEPRADKRDRLSFQYSLKDDYGVERLQLEMRLLSGGGGVYGVSPIETIDIPLTGSSVRETSGTDAALDLTKHVWAGRKVAGRLVAVDGKGQSAVSAEAFFIIADKIFIEPIAKAAAEQRQLIIAGLSENDGAYQSFAGRTAKGWRAQPRFQDWDFERTLERAPDPIQRAAALMAAITDFPMGLYDDPAVYMGLRHSLSTLRQAQNPDALSQLPNDLWQIAIRAEYGVLGTALEEMREAQVNLNEAMARRAPQREIDTLFERYNEAVDRYVEELRDNAEEAEATDEQGGGGGRNVDEIAELLKAIEQANKEGDSEGARLLLKKLAEFLENMKIQMAQGGQGGEGGDPSDSMSDEMKESLEDLADLLGEERELKDETEQAQRQAEAGSDPGQGEGQQQSGQNGGNNQGGQDGPAEQQGEQALSPSELAERQAAIAELLGSVRKKLDEEGSASAAGREQGQSGAGEENSQEDGAGGGEEDNPQGLGGGPNEDTPRAGGGNSGEPARDADSALDEAAQAMREAQDALKSGDFEAAQDAQAKAIATLREAARSLLAQASSGEGEGEDGEQSAGQGEGNPLDQEGEANNDFSDADIEQRDNAERSREILKELRRRASEQEREQSEKEYLEDLLKRF